MRPLEARARLTLAELEVRAGAVERGRDAIREAVAALRALGMSGWAERAPRHF